MTYQHENAQPYKEGWSNEKKESAREQNKCKPKVQSSSLHNLLKCSYSILSYLPICMHGSTKSTMLWRHESHCV